MSKYCLNNFLSVLAILIVIYYRLHKQKETLWSGCYSEVVKVKNSNGEDIILKISLINRANKAGVIVQNGSSVVTDVINSKLLSDLKDIPIHSAKNYCQNFAEIQKLYYAWSYRTVFNKSEVGSDNANKKYEYFICQQTYGGRKLDSLESMSPSVAVSLVLQLIASLAVAEAAYRFEHRDLHLSNLLYSKENKQKSLEYVIDDRKLCLRLNGFKLVIIDTTFSRTEIKVAAKNGSQQTHYFYNDLTCLNLEDYRNKQLKKVYLKQKEITGDKWKQFFPLTNIIWLSYCSKAFGIKVDKWCADKKCSPKEVSQLKSIQQRIDSSKSAKELCLKLIKDTNFAELDTESN